MARNRRNGNDDDLENRSSPFDDQDSNEEPESYGNEDSDEEYADEEDEAASGKKSPLGGNRLILLLVALAVILIVLLGILFFIRGNNKKKDEQKEATAPMVVELPSEQATSAPSSLIFGGGAPSSSSSMTLDDGQQSSGTEYTGDEVGQLPQEEEEELETEPLFVAQVPEATPVPTPEMVIQTARPTSTPAPSKPEVTESPLPVILTNTPTPSPSPTPTPTLEPTPTPTPSPVPKLGLGVVKKEGNLREKGNSGAKVIRVIKKGKELTILSAEKDKKGNLWFFVAVEGIEKHGFMRDYLISVNEEDEENVNEFIAGLDAQAGTSTDAKSSSSDVIGTGKLNKDANFRETMNGKLITQLRKGRRIEILSVRTDKKGETWYECRVVDGKKTGFIRTFLIDLDKGVDLDSGIQLAKETREVQVTPSPTPQTQVLDMEIIGMANIKKPANIREKPLSNAKVIRQLSKGISVKILAKVTSNGEIWYEVATDTGKTHGYVKEALLTITQLPMNLVPAEWSEK